jgi:hypothetical protein|nr:MAG TPA: hypothetical protein [Caudoviricetes sp.]
MQLIDADKLKKDILLQNILGEPIQKIIDRYIHIVDEQPTAFDVDKVVGELKRDKFIESECILSDVHQGYNAGLSRAIEIVKGGGVE